MYKAIVNSTQIKDKILFFILMFLVTLSLGQERSFYMGFTPWPYEATLEGVNWVHNTINTEGDIVSQHMDEGVPWQEAYIDTSFTQEFQNEINGRIAKKVEGKKVLLSIGPLNVNRSAMALYRGVQDNQPLPVPWNGYSLNSPQVKTAFLNYALRMVSDFQPDFLVFGIEVNLLITENPSLWIEYIELHRYIYTEIKRVYPSLPLSVSFVSTAFFPEWSSEHNLTDQLNGLNDIIDYVDFLSFSVHPFMSSLLCDTFPDNYFERLFQYSKKPVAISESSYPAQSWTLSSVQLNFNGSQEKQDNFLKQMLNVAETNKAKYVVWFAVRDFDTLWVNTLGQDQLSLIWRDTGLFDEDGNPRTAMLSWQNWLSKNMTANITSKNVTQMQNIVSINSYPNPFNPTTNILFNILEKSRIKIDIYNVHGVLIKRLADMYFNAGQHSIKWNGYNEQGIKITSGLYIIKLQAEKILCYTQTLFIK